MDQANVNRIEEVLHEAVSCHRQGRLAEAADLYKQILRQEPQNFHATHLLGIVAFQEGKLDIADDLVKKAIALDPQNFEAYSNRGNILFGLGRYDDALSSFYRALSLNLKHAETYYNMAIVLSHIGRQDGAIDSYKTAIFLKPAYMEAHLNLGNVYEQLGRFEDAVESYAAAIAIQPDYSTAYYNMGISLCKLRRFDQAEEKFRKAISIDPDYTVAHYNLGLTLFKLNRFEDAISSFDRALDLQPRHASAHLSKGTCFQELNRFDEAMECYDRALAVDPDYADAYWNKSIVHLIRGELPSGWRLAEWRKKKNDPVGDRQFPQHLWLGDEPIANKTLLIHHEQGLGDTIQFSRYIRELERRGANVLFAPQKALRELMKDLSATFSLVDVEDRSLRFDYHCPLLSLPLAFNTDIATIPEEIPYLKSQPQRVDYWKRQIGAQGFRIGVCWNGSQKGDELGRSFPLSELYDISQLEGVRLISLQKFDGLDQLAALPSEMQVTTLGERFDTGTGAFLDAAAVMDCCDLIITCDTSLAHLAGAMGIKTWLAQKYSPHWVWLLDRPDSPWYPTVRIFRQKSPGDWKGVFSEMKEALKHEIR